MDKVVIEIDEKALDEVTDKSISGIITEATQNVQSTTMSMSAGFRTGIWHDHGTGETLGDTAPEYAYSTRDNGRGLVGLVYTGNYSAMKDNYENNTLLKAMGAAHV